MMVTTRKRFKIARRLDWKSTRCLQPAKILRKLAVQDPKQRLSAVLATETPIMRMDDYFGVAVPEVLLMDGFELRANHSSIPLLLNADSSTVRNVVGSIRNMAVVDRQLVGVVHFGSDQKSQSIEARVRSGELSALELMVQPVAGARIDHGQVWRGVSGPANAVDRWFPIHASFTTKGSDPLTRVCL